MALISSGVQLVRGAVAEVASTRALGTRLAMEAALGEPWTVPYDRHAVRESDRDQVNDILGFGGGGREESRRERAEMR